MTEGPPPGGAVPGGPPSEVPLRALVVDDERLARERLRRLLADVPGVAVAGACASGAEAVDGVATLAPDLLLLDVQMPDLDGFGVLRHLAAAGVPLPAVVFVTAYDEYALRAFAAHAVDYVLKPVDAERLAAAVARVREGVRTRALADAHVALLRLAGAAARAREACPATGEPAGGGPGGRHRVGDRLYVRDGARGVFVRIADLDAAEARGNYVRLYAGGRTLMMRERLGAIEQLLEPHGFVRVHRSVVVNVARIAEVTPTPSGDHVAVLLDGTRLRFSRWYHARFERRLR